MEEKRQRIAERKILLEAKKKLREQKPKKIKPIIFTPEEEKQYEITKIKYYKEYLEYEEWLRTKELRIQQRKELQVLREERKKIREARLLEQQNKIVLREQRRLENFHMQEEKDQQKKRTVN